MFVLEAYLVAKFPRLGFDRISAFWLELFA